MIFQLTSRCIKVKKQAEYDLWCERHARVFETVKLDASELNRLKSVLHLASGGNPLLLESFRAEFDSLVQMRFLLF